MLLIKSTLINLNKYVLAVEEKFPFDANIYVTTRRNLPFLAMTLLNSDQFSANYLNEMFVIDNFGKNYRFVVVYRFSDLDNVVSFTVMTASIEGIAVFSVENLYIAVSWPEREA
jgi:NADH:ubiquinone oxidoreductase subunit C